MRVLILGGDGYLGWPTAINLSKNGHAVWVVDNYFRRTLSSERNLPPLIPVPDLHARVQCWKNLTGRDVVAKVGDVSDYAFLVEVFRDFEPEAVIHYAEQPSAPYSMMGYKEARFTLTNNLLTTLNVAYAVNEVNPKIHILKLGTMGEYGTPNIDIEEGYIDIEYKGRKERFLFPREGASLYHTTKIQDTDLLNFYVRVWNLRVTDLMQGPVYGIFTDEMNENQSLYTSFHYDGLFGTVLNRFIVQAASGVPLTVYGKGGQTRGFINIVDTLSCVALALETPAEPGVMDIYNQFTEIFSVKDLAERVIAAASMMNMKAEIINLPNPRKESEDHYYNPAHSKLRDLGLVPNLLDNDLLARMLKFVSNNTDLVRQDIIQPQVCWS